MCVCVLVQDVCTYECGRQSVYLKKRGGGFFLSISMHLLQIVSIYLFIFPRREKMCERVCVCVCLSDYLCILKS